MTDRELLELAAKAIGLCDAWPRPYFEATWQDDGLWCSGMGRGVRWNPLIDDGDALRLAVKLGLIVDLRYTDQMAIKYNRVNYWPRGKEASPYQHIAFDDHLDADAATRRAIVRAAAAIGEKMQ